MASRRVHHSIAVQAHRVPAPFASFAVRSDEARHALQARSPYGRAHLVRPALADDGALGSLAAKGWERVQVATQAQGHLASFSDIVYATTTLADLAAAAPQVADLPRHIAQALQLTGVLGTDLAPYLHNVHTRIDYLASCGAGFHNDVSGAWSRSLFWVLALDLADVEFVMPHTDLRLPLVPGDLLVFDQTLAHGLCRAQDEGQAVAASFEGQPHAQQIFLTGELRLSDAQWAALGAPWLPVQAHAQRQALDLLVAEFDERSGAIKRLRALRDGMLSSTCHVDAGGA